MTLMAEDLDPGDARLVLGGALVMLANEIRRIFTGKGPAPLSDESPAAHARIEEQLALLIQSMEELLRIHRDQKLIEDLKDAARNPE